MNPTSLTTFSSDAGGTSFNTASISPTANRLVLASVLNADSDGSAATPTGSGNGLTWQQIATVTFFSGLARLTLFRAMGASPSAGAFTASFGADSQDIVCTINICEIGDGVETGGSHGSAAVVQNDPNTGDGTALSAALAAFTSANNATFAVWAGSNETSAITDEVGWTEVNEIAGVLMAFLDDPDTTPTATQTVNDEWAAIAIEIAAAAVGGISVPVVVHHMKQQGMN
jgi:hypothetical protein